MTVPRPDSEAAMVAWLTAGGFPAATRVPDAHVNGMVRVSRIGGERTSVITETVTMLVETWHSSALEASIRAHALSARVEAAEDGQNIGASTRVYNVITTGPAEFPDDSSPLVRYQFTVTFTARRS